MRLRLQPRTPSGDVDAAATVSVRAVVGVTGGIGAPLRDGDGWTVKVSAPMNPGDTVFEVTLGERVSQVRPRVTWTLDGT